MRALNKYRNQGQAMVEFVVMTAGCLLMLFILVPVVAKLSDMAYKAQEVARYTAWERTVWYSPVDSDAWPSLPSNGDGHIAMRTDTSILNSAESRVMSYGSAILPLSPHDIDPTLEESNRFWRWTHNSTGQGMVENNAMVQGSVVGAEMTPSIAYTVLDTYNDVMRVVAKVVSIFSFDFSGNNDDFLQVAHPVRNFYTTQIEIPVPLINGALGRRPLLGERFELQQLSVGARSAVLADGWIPQNEQHFREKADDFVLGSLVENNSIWPKVRGLIGFFEPSFKDVDFAPVNTDPMRDDSTACDKTSGFCYYKKDDK